MGSELIVTASEPSETAIARFKDRVRARARALVTPAVVSLTALGVRPLAVTVTGLVLSLFAGLAFAVGAFGWGALVLAASGVCDMLDGQLARHQNSVSTLGAFLDSTLDRIGEALVLTGIAAFYLSNLVQLGQDPLAGLSADGWGAREHAIVCLTAVAALIASFLVSYTRARAEGLGLECKVGWFERPERMILLIVAGAFGVGPMMPAALVLLAILSSATAVQRMAHVWTKTRESNGRLGSSDDAKPDSRGG